MSQDAFKLELTKAESKDFSQVVELLKTCDLPTDDLTEDHMSQFWLVRKESDLIATCGLELAGGYGLLRSLAVTSQARSRGIGRQLVELVEMDASTYGLKAIYLLTTGAQGYFSKQGYQQIARSEAPAAIQYTSEFATVCPDSAVCMVKMIS